MLNMNYDKYYIDIFLIKYHKYNFGDKYLNNNFYKYCLHYHKLQYILIHFHMKYKNFHHYYNKMNNLYDMVNINHYQSNFFQYIKEYN